MQKNFKEKEENSNVRLNKWEEKVAFKNKNLMKSESNLKVREEKVHRLRLQF